MNFKIVTHLYSFPPDGLCQIWRLHHGGLQESLNFKKVSSKWIDNMYFHEYRYDPLGRIRGHVAQGFR